MRTDNHHTAVLFFSRSAKAEGARKQFVGEKNRRKNVRVARSLIEHTHQQLRQTGLPVYEVDEKLQQGNTFGDRLANAFAFVFSKGYRNVIAVGNDTPKLKSAHIHHAKELLSEEKAHIVLGPAEDGGTWLMGYSREAFSAPAFRKLPWNSNRLLHSILEHAGDNFSVTLLEPHSDIDNYASLKAFTGRHGFSKALLRLIEKIRSIIGLMSVPDKQLNSRLPGWPTLSTQLLRAPPRWIR